MAILNQLIGFAGLIIMLVAYFLLSKGKLAGRSNLYQVLNLIGAIALGYNALVQEAWPIVALEIFWCFVAVSTLLSIKKQS